MLPRTRLHPFKETQKQSLQHYKDPVTECRIQPLNQAPFVQDSRRGHIVNGTSGKTWMPFSTMQVGKTIAKKLLKELARLY